VQARPPGSRDALTERLRDEILSGELPAGSKLPPERVLAQDFALSRPIVREVLRGLQERGLVEILPARGTFVRAPSAADGVRSLESYYRRRNATAREVMDARLMLEVHAVRLAALNATAADVHALEQCQRDADDAQTVVDRARNDIAFHGLLARASHNTVIATMFASITGLTFELMLRSQADPQVILRGMPLHRRIIDAIRARAPDDAEAAMREHLELAATLYGSDYDRSVETVAQRVLGPHLSLDGLLDEVTRRVEAAARAS
jgi:GntR family transcriptional regulator, transcriptional repressor for pyruvate dehydrogenase complex